MDTKKMAYCLKKNGITNLVFCAALLGNFMAESGLKANNLQNTFNTKLGLTDEEYTQNVDEGKISRDQFAKDGAGYGLAQWTFWSRKDALYKYMRGHDLSIGDLEGQLDFAVYELRTSYSGIFNQLSICNDLRTAVSIILKNYERPADQSAAAVERRYYYSKQIYDEIKSAFDSDSDRREDIFRQICEELKKLLALVEEGS